MFMLIFNIVPYKYSQIPMKNIQNKITEIDSKHADHDMRNTQK